MLVQSRVGMERGEGAPGKEAPVRVGKGVGREGEYERWLRIYSSLPLSHVLVCSPSNLRNHEQEAAVVKRTHANAQRLDTPVLLGLFCPANTRHIMNDI